MEDEASGSKIMEAQVPVQSQVPPSPPAPAPSPTPAHSPCTLLAIICKTGEVHLGLACALIELTKVHSERSFVVAWFSEVAQALKAFVDTKDKDRLVIINGDNSVPSPEFVLHDAKDRDFVVASSPLDSSVDWEKVEEAVSKRRTPDQIAEAGRRYGFRIEDGSQMDSDGYVECELTHPAGIVSLSRRAAEEFVEKGGWEQKVCVDVARPCSTYGPRAFGGMLNSRQGELR